MNELPASSRDIEPITQSLSEVRDAVVVKDKFVVLSCHRLILMRGPPFVITGSIVADDVIAKVTAARS